MLRRGIYVLAIFGFTLLIAQRLFVGYLKEPVHIEDGAASNNNEYYAYVYTDSGGGAGFGWCQMKVAVLDLRNKRPMSEVFGSKQTVFYIDSCEAGIKVSWEENVADALVISCPSTMAVQAARVIVKKTSAREVKISYSGCPLEEDQ